MLSDADRAWLETQFLELRNSVQGVHGRITEHALDDEARLGKIDVTLEAFRVAPCPSVSKHVEEKHNAGRLWAMLAAFVAVAMGLFEALKAIFSIGHKP